MPKVTIPTSKIDEVHDILSSEGLSFTQLSNARKYQAKNSGIINVFNNGTVNFQGQAEAKKQVEEFFCSKCGHLFGKDENMYFSFLVPLDKRNMIENHVKSFIKSNSLGMDESKPDKALYRLTITDDKKNKITLTHYANDKILLQGLRSKLWDEFVDEIASFLKMEVKTSVAQILAKPGEEVKIESFVQTNEIQQAEEIVKTSLGDAYNYINEHAKKLFVSSQIVLNVSPTLLDYYTCISGTLRGLEGFIKDILVSIKAYTAREIHTRFGENKWDFGKAFSSGKLTTEVENCLSSNTAKKKLQRTILINSLKYLKEQRNPLSHMEPVPYVSIPIPTLSKALEIQTEILGYIKSTHEAFKDEIK